ncbi:hypothetical protein ABPG72_012278 [Tetrahymena utriculariae]
MININKNLFKIEFNPNNFPKEGNLEIFYKDAFKKCHGLLEKNQINALDFKSLEQVQHLTPNSGFLYAKNSEEQSKDLQQSSLEAIIKQLNLYVFIDKSLKLNGKMQSFKKFYFLIGVKPNTNIYARVVSLIKLDEQIKNKDLLDYYLVHFYEYQEISSANIELMNHQLKNEMEIEMERENEITHQHFVKEEFQENQQSNENKQTKKIKQLENQIQYLQLNQIQQEGVINILIKQINKIEQQLMQLTAIEIQD